MSHSFVSGNSSQNTYLNKKRLEDDIPMEPRYHYDKYSKYDKYNSQTRYNPMNYMHSKSQGNGYYNGNSRYRGNYYNSQNYKFGPKRDYKKSYQKYSNPNSNEGIRNLSNCDLTPSPPPLSLKKSEDSISTRYDSKTKLSETNGNGININNINKLVSNITSRLPQNNHSSQPIYHNGQQNINIQIELTPDSLRKDDYSNSKRKKSMEEAKNEEDDMMYAKFPKKSEKLLNFEPFDRSLVKIEENPLDNFDLYPNNLFGNNTNESRKNNMLSHHNLSKNNIIGYNLGIKSCYLLAKIPNWRLVTNFVPASALNEEKFENILPLDEGGDEKEKNSKSFLVYDEKYEEMVNKYLEPNMNKSNQTEKAVFNFKFIIASFHYDIPKIKNKINKTKFKINYLTIKQENSRNAIEQKFKV